MTAAFSNRRNERTATLADQQDKQLKTMQDYVGDMVSLESHIEEALDRQLKETKDNPQALAAVQRFHDMVKHNRDHMKQYQEQIGSTGGNPITAVGSAVLGKAAGLIDMVRTEGISKALRDNYTAFNLAAMGYTMLYTTSTALGNTELATICEEHLRNYAKAIQELNQLVPSVVLDELAKDGHQINPSVAGQVRSMVNEAWKDTNPTSGMGSDMSSGLSSSALPG